MEQLELLKLVAGVIEDMGLRYFVTGSTATIFYGEPRFTNDIDIVVELSECTAVALCRRFSQDDFYFSEQAARAAAISKSQFNIIHPASGLKVDVIVPEENTFNESRFARSRRFRAAPDFEASFASPEDAIIKKMEYFRQGGSEKHLRDIAGVLKTTRDRIDITYISKWAQVMGLGELWTAIQKKSDHNS